MKAASKVGIVGAGLVFIVLLIGSIPLLGYVVFNIVQTDYLRGLLILVVFILVQIKLGTRARGEAWVSDKQALAVAVLLIFVFFAVCFDQEGNPLFNKPLEWLVAPFGSLSSQTSVETYGPTIAWGTSFFIVRPDGTTFDLPFLLIALYRALQYSVLLGVLWVVNDKTLVRLVRRFRKAAPTPLEAPVELDDETKARIEEEVSRRELAEDGRKKISPQLYARLKRMKQEGKTIEAIKLLRDETEQAYSLAEAKEIVGDIEGA